MTFKDLPSDVRGLQLTDRTLQGDVVDLILSDADRRGGSMAMMLCDSDLRPFQPVVVGGVSDADAGDCLTRLVDILAHVVTEEMGALLIARGRPGPSTPTDDDRALHQMAIDRCSARGVTLLGAFVATPAGVTALPEALTAAS